MPVSIKRKKRSARVVAHADHVWWLFSKITPHTQPRLKLNNPSASTCLVLRYKHVNMPINF